MTAAIVFPLLKLFIITFGVMIAASFAVSIICDFLNINRQIPLIVTAAVVVILLYPQLRRQMKDILMLIFR